MGDTDWAQPRPADARMKARQAAVEGVVEAARYWASAYDTGEMPDGRSIETSCEELVEAVEFLDLIDGRKKEEA